MDSKELIARANEKKKGKSPEYCAGFEDGVVWILKRMEEEICQSQTHQSEKSEEE